MAGWLGALGQQAASSAVSGGMGMGFSRMASRYDRRMNKKLQMQQMGIQMAGEREMMNYQQDKDLEMIGKSSKAQVEALRKAGLNPALMYGMGGEGGLTTGHGGGPAVGGQAPYVDTAPRGMNIESIAQLRLMEAQAKNIEADTKLKQVDATKKVGVDTENVVAQTKGILLNNEFLQKSMNDRIDIINSEAAKQIAEIDIIEGERDEQRMTRMDRVSKIKQEAIGELLKNTLIGEQTKATTQSIEESKQRVSESKVQIDKWAQEIQQGWEKLNQSDKQIRLEGLMKNLEQEYMNNRYKFGEFQMRWHDREKTKKAIEEILNK